MTTMPRSRTARSTHLAIAMLAALAWLAPIATAAHAEPPDLIPIEVLFDNPTQTMARVSPDGSTLSYLAPSEEGVMNVWIRPLEGEGEPRMVTADDDRGIRAYFWSEDSRRILYIQDIGGNENWHVYSADLESGVTRDLTPFQGIRAQGIYTDRETPGEILVGLNLRNRRAFDVYRVNLDTGAVVLDTENPGDVRGWLTDAEFQIRAASAANPQDGSTSLRVRDAPGEPWRELIQWPFEESGGAVMFSADGKSIFVESSLGSDTTRLIEVDLASGEEIRELAKDERADVGELLTNDETRTVDAVSFDYLKPEWTVLDDSVAGDFEKLAGVHEGAFSIVSRDRADDTWIVAYENDQGPLAYYAYDRESGAATHLFDNRPALADYTLAEMKPLVIEARDGLKLVSYLTLPPGSDGKNLPLVLNVHGGPWGRDTWGYDSTAQWLANRGYAVLQVNFRASTGFGKAFLNAGNREWGQGKMQHDLTDAVKWAVDTGLADPEKVAIMGGSYGGYATLAGLTFTPELYACGVDIVGMSNMKTTFATIPPYWETMKKMLLKRVGDAENDDEYNRRISPLFHADKIRSPLLIAQGANDPRVNINESNQIVEAMRANELPVTYVVYTDEGHGFARPENQMDFRYRTDAFLASCLGGRSEPMQEVEGTTAELR